MRKIEIDAISSLGTRRHSAATYYQRAPPHRGRLNLQRESRSRVESFETTPIAITLLFWNLRLYKPAWNGGLDFWNI